MRLSKQSLIKLYTSLKCLITFYLLLCVLTYYCYFIRAKIYQHKNLTKLYIVFCLAIMMTPYMTYNGDSDRTPDMEVYITVFVMSNILHILVLKQLKWEFREFIHKNLPQSFDFRNYDDSISFRYLWFLYLKINLLELSDSQGNNLYMIFLSFYSTIYLETFKICLIKFSMLVKAEKYPNMNPIIFVARICLCYTIAIQISTLVNFNPYHWGCWLLVSQYCAFLI